VGRTFRGEGLHKVDAKGRVSIPASFRRVLEASDPEWKAGEAPQIVIVYGPARQRYLECYTMEAIDEVDAKIKRMPRGSQARRMLERMFSGQAHPTSVDESGRLVLPAKLREKIGLTGEAYFIATGDTFQIWDNTTFETEEQSKADEWLDEQGEDFDPLTLLDAAAEE